jgi:hypothetical protein
VVDFADAATVEFGNETEPVVVGMADPAVVLPELEDSLPGNGKDEGDDKVEFEMGETPVSVLVPEVAAGVAPGAELDEVVGIGPRFDVPETVPELPGAVLEEGRIELV